MKNKSSDLIDLSLKYQAQCRRASRDDCPSPDDLIGYLRNQLKGRKHQALVNHISKCIDCARETKFILEMLRQEDQFISDVERIVNPVSSVKKRKINQKKILLPALPVMRFKYGMALLIALCAVILIPTFLLKYSKNRSVERGSLSKIEILQPAKPITSVSTLHFKWRDNPGVSYWIFEFYSDSLSLIWRSGKLDTPELSPPPEFIDEIGIEKKYFWMVTGFREDESYIESDMNELSLKK